MVFKECLSRIVGIFFRGYLSYFTNIDLTIFLGTTRATHEYVVTFFKGPC